MVSETSKILSEEHENILKVVEALDKKCDLVENGKDIDKEFFEKIVDFIRNYTDKFHHAKEEDILFKEFVKKIKENDDEVHCNPVEQMLHEHDIGRAFIKEMETGMRERDKEKLIRGARGYMTLIREHIFKEDNILYPMADGVLENNVKKEMLDKFEKIGKDRANEKKKYLAFIGSLNK